MSTLAFGLLNAWADASHKLRRMKHYVLMNKYSIFFLLKLLAIVAMERALYLRTGNATLQTAQKDNCLD